MLSPKTTIRFVHSSPVTVAAESFRFVVFYLFVVAIVDDAFVCLHLLCSSAFVGIFVSSTLSTGWPLDVVIADQRRLFVHTKLCDASERAYQSIKNQPTVIPSRKWRRFSAAFTIFIFLTSYEYVHRLEWMPVFRYNCRANIVLKCSLLLALWRWIGNDWTINFSMNIFSNFIHSYVLFSLSSWLMLTIHLF